MIRVSNLYLPSRLFVIVAVGQNLASSFLIRPLRFIAQSLWAGRLWTEAWNVIAAKRARPDQVLAS